MQKETAASSYYIKVNKLRWWKITAIVGSFEKSQWNMMWQHSRFEKSTIVTQHRPPHHVRFSWHPCILLIAATISKQSYLDSFELWEFLIRTTQKVFGFTPAHYSSNTFCFFHPLPLKSCVLSSAHTAFRSWNANILSNLKSCSIKSPWTYRGRKSPRNRKDREFQPIQA